ncbi:hypothetical protein VTN02DRAFT_5268 [Thermoascus thermophilus]
MSTPTRQLRRLSIGDDMSVTRSRAHRELEEQARPDGDGDSDLSDGSGDEDGMSEEEGCMSRQEKVRDIISAFRECILPEDFRPDLVETAEQSRTPEQCVVQGDFEATMFRLAVHDDNVYVSLRKAMPAGACAAIYFDKVHERLRRLLADFDRYRETGYLPADGSSMDVRAVVSRLRQEVSRIETNIAARFPYGTKEAAEALVNLLKEISTRNIDAFEGNTWGRVPLPDEDEDDRNLYEQLIGRTDHATDAQEFFVLDALEQLPTPVLQAHYENLISILDTIEVNRARRSYILKLRSLVQEALPTSSGHKRPAAGVGGSSTKRTR